MKIIPPPLRRAWISFCRERFGEAAIRFSQPSETNAAPVSLHMVVSRHTWKMGLMALRSLEFHTARRWAPFIHEDGSLTDEDATLLMRLQPDARLIRRTEADTLMAERLAAWPVCRENRRKHNWFIKFFDTYFHAEHQQYIVLDSDIVFFRSPQLILDWIERQADTLHVMKDTREAYASPRVELEAGMEFPFWPLVNSGICLMHKPAVSLDLAERFMTLFADKAEKYMFLEQSLFALTGSAWKKGGHLPAEYEISWGNFRRRDAVCRHYVGPFKDDLLWIEGAFSFWMDQKFDRRRS